MTNTGMLDEIKAALAEWDNHFQKGRLDDMIDWLDSHTYEKQDGDDEFFTELAKRMREIWPPGNKSGMYPWRESVSNLTIRLRALWRSRNIKTRNIEEVLTVARRYVAQYENDLTYMRTLKYFVYKHVASLPNQNKKTKIICESPLADMLEGKSDADFVMNEWDGIFNNIIQDEGELI